MSLFSILACTTLGGLAAGLGVALVRSRAHVRRLTVALEAAGEAQKTKDSLLKQMSQLDTIKDEFISTVSHELRTPLTSIRGSLGLLNAGLMGAVDAKAQNLLRIALSNTDRLIRLINDILDLERMESGRAPLHIRRCSMQELARQAIETMTPMADAAEVRLAYSHAGAAETLFFDGDPDRILQILTNLLSNAIKFSPPASHVHLRLEPEDEAVVVRVSDQGRGIPVEKLDAIFDRFGQVEASDARQKGGTGLGLAICRTIAQQHHGTIWAESNEQSGRGPGAVLILSLPRMSRLATLDDDLGETLLPTAGEATLLVCDDDAGVRTVVGEHLRRHGYTILEAENGEQALELAGQTQVAAILLDLYMPGLTGWETLRRLKRNAATAEIPVVILSVLSPGDGGVPAEGWVQKPFNEHLLLAELSRVLHTGDGPPHVLLVEDDQDLARVVIAGFQEAQVHIEYASTRAHAVEHCRLSRPDLLILDLTLPDGDGFSLVDWLRRQPHLRSLPLVVYSGREVSETERSQLRLGPTQFFTKAKVQPREIEELVLNIVQRLRPAVVPGRPVIAEAPLSEAYLVKDR